MIADPRGTVNESGGGEANNSAAAPAKMQQIDASMREKIWSG